MVSADLIILIYKEAKKLADKEISECHKRVVFSCVIAKNLIYYEVENNKRVIDKLWQLYIKPNQTNNNFVDTAIIEYNNNCNLDDGLCCKENLTKIFC